MITSRLHCAAPCAAMGIPVIFAVTERSSRFAWIETLLPVYTPEQYAHIDWNPKPAAYEPMKKKMEKFGSEPFARGLFPLGSLKRNQRVFFQQLARRVYRSVGRFQKAGAGNLKSWNPMIPISCGESLLKPRTLSLFARSLSAIEIVCRSGCIFQSYLPRITDHPTQQPAGVSGNSHCGDSLCRLRIYYGTKSPFWANRPDPVCVSAGNFIAPCWNITDQPG